MPDAGQIYKLIPQIMGEVGAIGKNRRNPQQNYAFRGIDDFYNALHEPMAKAGVFVLQEVLDERREERQRVDDRGQAKNALFYTVMKVKHTFCAPDASTVCVTTVGEAMDSGDKASNKALSAAMKYAMIGIFCIPTEESKDSENDSPEVQPRQSPTKPATQPAPKEKLVDASPAGLAEEAAKREFVESWRDYVKGHGLDPAKGNSHMKFKVDEARKKNPALDDSVHFKDLLERLQKGEFDSWMRVGEKDKQKGKVA